MLNRPTFFGRLREDCEDFIFGLEDEFSTAKEQIKDKYSAARQRVPSVLRDLNDVKREIQVDAAQDLNDLNEAFRDFRQSLRKSSRSQAAAAAAADDDDVTPVVTPDETTTTNRQEQIRRYESDLRSTFFVSELNKMVEESISSSDELRAYYESRPELAAFTIEKELHRMAYTVFTHEGKKLTEPAEIEAYYRSTSIPDNTDDNNSISNNAILWRSANQSLLGDLIVSLTSRTSLVRPQLEAATFVSDLTMVLDFARDQPTAQAECFLNLSIPGLEGEQLSLAGVLVVVYFCPDEKKFRARISHVFPSKALSEEEVNGAARALS